MSWVLIANRAGARILDKQDDQFSLIEEIPHEEGRLRDHEIDSDRPGRAYARTTAARHSLGAAEEPHEHIAKGFARTLADKLRLARIAGRVERLVLVAEPRFLGILKDALDEPTRRLVVATVPKDLQQMSLKDLPSHLSELPRRFA